MNDVTAEAQNSDFRIAALDHACQAALEAWRAIAPLYEGDVHVEQKPDGPVTEADRLADRLIVEHLSAVYPRSEYGYLTEESEDSTERLSRRRAWIIDPIDGTRDFIKKNGNFAIHVALVERQDSGEFHPVVGVVYRPTAGLLFSAIAGRGSFCRRVTAAGELEAAGVPCHVDARRDAIGRLRSVVSNTIKTSRLMRLIESLGLESFWHVGSMGVKVTTIAQGGAELYLVAALDMVKEWDACAPCLVLTEAGGRMTDLLCRPLTYNRPDVYLRCGLLASNGPVHQELSDRVKLFLASEGVLLA